MSFDESKHPRDSDGKFTDGTADYKYPQYLSRMNGHEGRQEENNPNTFLDSLSGRESKKDLLGEIMGKEFRGVKAQDAINKLLMEKQGHVKAAFHRNDIGDIDLLWGNDTFGLQHIVKQRESQGINIKDFVKDLSDVIEYGEFYQKSERGNFEFLHNGKMAIIAPEYHGQKITFVLTAYKTRKKRRD